MVYASKRTCDSCDKSKPDTEFYKTIKDICKICRDERMREERQRSKEEESVDRKRTQDFRNLRRAVVEQAETIDDMKIQIGAMRKKMANMREELDELSDLKAKMKGMTLGRIKAKSG